MVEPISSAAIPRASRLPDRRARRFNARAFVSARVWLAAHWFLVAAAVLVGAPSLIVSTYLARNIGAYLTTNSWFYWSAASPDKTFSVNTRTQCYWGGGCAILARLKGPTCDRLIVIDDSYSFADALDVEWTGNRVFEIQELRITRPIEWVFPARARITVTLPADAAFQEDPCAAATIDDPRGPL